MNKSFKTLFTIFLGILFFIPSFTANSAEKDKKDDKSKCVYCEKYKQLKDWPLSERPEAYVYEEMVKQPEQQHRQVKRVKEAKEVKDNKVKDNNIEIKI